MGKTVTLKYQSVDEKTGKSIEVVLSFHVNDNRMVDQILVAQASDLSELKTLAASSNQSFSGFSGLEASLNEHFQEILKKATKLT